MTEKWYVEKPFSGDADRTIYMLTPKNKNPVFIARVYGQGCLVERNKETDQRAALIAVAPEMLEACKEALDFLEDGTPDIDLSPMESNVRQILRAVIYKAKGE